MNRKAAACLLTFAATVTASFNLNGQVLLTHGHTDIAILYESGSWDLHIGQHEATPPMEYAPNEATIGVDIGLALQTVPAGSQWSFLGAPGSSVWILPQAENPELPFLGLATEEIEPGLFVDDQVTLSLRAVRAPGRFSLFELGVFGEPTVFMHSGDGITATDSLLLSVQSHRHANFAFSEPGVYEIDFEASGILVEGITPASSGPVTYTFAVQVVPEPGVATLLIAGAAGFYAWRRFRGGAEEKSDG